MDKDESKTNEIESFKEFDINISVRQCRNAKKYALNENEGRLNSYYEKLRSYDHKNLISNLDSTVKMDINIILIQH